MKKYIFLDIDGVIATPESIDDGGMWALVQSKQELLGYILNETGAEIIMSSSWRKSTVDETKEYMTSKGFWYSDRITGVTIRAYNYIKGIHLSIPRGVEIKQWIDVNVRNENGTWTDKRIGDHYNYVILDDDNDMLLTQAQRFIRCDSKIGLTEIIAYKAISLLNHSAL